MLMSHRNKGFTLIELLVVISVIGVIASLVLSSINSAREKAEINSRLSQANQLKRALLYYQLDTGNFPITSNNTGYCLGKGSSETCWGAHASGNDAVNTALESYISMGPFAGEPDDDGRGYIIYNGNTSLTGCNGDRTNGFYVFWKPDNFSGGSTSCPGESKVSCCPLGLGLCGGAYGYYCALPVELY